MTEAEQQEIDVTTARLRRLARWVVLAGTIAVSGLALGGVSLAVQASASARNTDRNTWDDASRAHTTCVAAAATRLDTISLEHDRFAREETGIDDDEATVDLIEQNVLTLISYAGLPADSPIALAATNNIAKRRVRLDARRASLAAAIADFDQKRPVLDPAACPPAPAGNRP